MSEVSDSVEGGGGGVGGVRRRRARELTSGYQANAVSAETWGTGN